MRRFSVRERLGAVPFGSPGPSKCDVALRTFEVPSAAVGVPAGQAYRADGQEVD